MRYLKGRWNESRGDDFDNWGFVTFYFEIAEDFFPTRQIEVYDNGNVLKYDYEHQTDKFGMLADKSLENAFQESDVIEILQDEFENVWTSQKAFNR